MKDIMKLLSNPWVTGAALAACVAVFHVANTTSTFGKFINRFYPCTDTPVGVSMPCYAKHDIVIMVVAGILGLVFLGLFVRDLVLSWNAR